ncbi:unnamed protein product [Clavelina lepadiformis]|uniref:Uncharacterized protein n=1 Tax=Clavelina lepadiformis TaxID=159417 RepID=A0ABP0FQI5_CLALP
MKLVHFLNYSMMRLCPDHFIWKRERNSHHGGAKRNCRKTAEEKEPFPRGPGRSPIPCKVCTKADSSSGYLSDDGILANNPVVFFVAQPDSSPDEYFSASSKMVKQNFIALHQIYLLLCYKFLAHSATTYFPILSCFHSSTITSISNTFYPSFLQTHNASRKVIIDQLMWKY